MHHHCTCIVTMYQFKVLFNQFLVRSAKRSLMHVDVFRQVLLDASFLEQASELYCNVRAALLSPLAGTLLLTIGHT